MSYLFDGIDDYLERNSAIKSATPFTVLMWIKTTDVNTTQNIFCSGTSGSDNQAHLLQAAGTADDRIRAQTRTTSGVFADTTTQYTTAIWLPIVGVFASTTDRRAFISGGSKGTNATSRVPSPLPSYTRIGTSPLNTGPFSGLIAKVCFWGIALDDADVASASAAADPSTVQSGSVLSYWPLSSDANDVVGTNHLTVSGAVLDSDNPGAITKTGIGIIGP